METEQKVARHYGRDGLEQAILAALAASGKDIAHLKTADLAAADEFHLGWRAQTVAFALQLGLARGQKVLDIGAGIGGPARYFAQAHGCNVTGIDLTPEFVAVATALTQRCGLGGEATFRLGSALALPCDDGAFDAATLIHVGMNIADKAGLFAEARRALKPGGRFGIYDVMLVEGRSRDLPYPMPWAETAETSFVESPEAYRRLLEGSGFTIETQRNRREFSLELGREMRARAAASGTPPLGLHIIMGPAATERLKNVMGSLEHNVIAPIEIIARAS
jgi:SAM-dependent methyltransferase